MSLIGGIESYELREGVSISSGVGSYTSSGLVVISNKDYNSSYVSGSLALNSENITNCDSRNMSLNTWHVVSDVRESMNVFVGCGDIRDNLLLT